MTETMHLQPETDQPTVQKIQIVEQTPELPESEPIDEPVIQQHLQTVPTAPKTVELKVSNDAPVAEVSSSDAVEPLPSFEFVEQEVVSEEAAVTEAPPSFEPTEFLEIQPALPVDNTAEIMDAEEPVSAASGYLSKDLSEQLTSGHPEDVVLAKQVETFISYVPEVVETSLVEFLMTAEPEEHEATVELIFRISEAAERLHVLSVTEQDQPQEAAMIELLLSEWYEELLTTLGLTYDESAIAAFITFVRSEQYRLPIAEEEQPIDEGMRNFKRGIASFARSISEARQALTQEIGRIVLQQAA